MVELQLSEVRKASESVAEEKGTDRRLFMRFMVVQADIHELAMGGDQKIKGGCTNWLLKSANHLIEIFALVIARP